MDAILPVLLLLAVPVLVGLGFWAQHVRTKRLQAWAASIGWTYVGTDASLARRWRGQPFGTGDSRRVSELVVGTFAGRPAMSFAYRYTTGSGKNRSTHTFHVVAMALPAYLPMLELTPDGLGAKLAKTFGGQDVVLESEDFNRAWRVRAADERVAHAILHPRLMERLLRPDAVGRSVRIEGTDVLCWSPGSPRTEAVAARLTLMAAVADAIPRFVWLDHGYDPGT